MIISCEKKKSKNIIICTLQNLAIMSNFMKDTDHIFFCVMFTYAPTRAPEFESGNFVKQLFLLFTVKNIK